MQVTISRPSKELNVYYKTALCCGYKEKNQLWLSGLRDSEAKRYLEIFPEGCFLFYYIFLLYKYLTSSLIRCLGCRIDIEIIKIL